MDNTGPFPRNVNDTFKYRSTSVVEDIQESIISLWPWPENLQSTLKGLLMSDSNLMQVEDHNIILRRDHLSLSKKVKIASGGRIGHEPLFMNYVGPGMLAGCVLGTRFNAPLPNDILILLKELSYGHTAGILLIISNNREEVLNFGLAMERARCENILVDMITVGDDAYDSCKSDFGRRCLAGIVLMFKIAGAMSDAGRNMKEIYLYLRKFKMATISCHITTTSFIGTDFLLGSGQFVDTTDIAYLVSLMIDYLVNPRKYFSLSVEQDSTFVLLLNCYTFDRFLLYAAVKEVMEQLTSRDVHISRVYAGTFVTGDRGFSITLGKDFDDSLINWTEKSCLSSVWPKTDARGEGLVLKGPVLPVEPIVTLGPYVDEHQLIVVDKAVTFACKALHNSERLLNGLDIDRIYGSALLPAVEAILSRHERRTLYYDRPYNMLNTISDICENLIPTILGTIYSIFFSGAAQGFLHYAKTTEMKDTMWIDSLFKGINAVKVFTKIKEGDMSFLDILSPFAYKLKTSEAEDILETLTICIEKCEELLISHSKLKSPLKREGLPEVNCQATVIVLRAIVEGIKAGHTADLSAADGLDDRSFDYC